MSLGQNRTHTSRASALQKSDRDKLQSNLTSVCTTINGKFHTCIDKLIHEDTAHPHVMENINIDQFISKLDPDIWRAVCLMTQPHSSKGNEKSNVRKIRQVFCTCALMFTTNSKCSFPFHTLIADAVETCGGSSRLMRLLNRLGVCVSTDTHARYIQYRIRKSTEEGPMSVTEYPDKAFTVVSADNLDYVHSYDRVYCGKQQSSWHSTTVQVVQPRSSKSFNTYDGICIG